MLPFRDPSLPIELRVRDLLNRMTLEEKVAQLCNMALEYDDFLGKHGPEAQANARKAIANGAGALGRPSLNPISQDCSARETAELTNALQKYLVEETRLGIPALFQEEALHGLMASGSTCFPQAIGLASTWDPELVERIFHAAALETRARGGTHVFTPVLDLARDPRWGRTEETYGEDPYLASRIGVAAIRGLQGSDSNTRDPRFDDRHVIATAKHFAVHGQPEGGTNCAPANYAERDIREFFLKPFQAAITEAGALSVMASYNEINGIPVHVNRWLLQQVLRQEWGFRGLLISDGGGLQMLANEHHVAADYAEAARKALGAGIEFDLSDGEVYATLTGQVRAGMVPEVMVDAAAADVLRIKFLLGLFETPYVDPAWAEQITNCTDHQALAYEAALKAMVLLKNEGNLLPLDPVKVRTLTVIGPNARELHTGGYSYDPRGVSVLDGLYDYGKKHNIEILYAEGCRITEGEQGWMRWWRDEAIPSNPAEDEARIAEAVAIARRADMVLLVLGENESLCREAWSDPHTGDRDSLDLPGRQDDLVRAVLAEGKPTAALLINGRPLSVNLLAERCPAILEGWYLGQATGQAVADVLFGEAAPNGRLPITFPRSVGQVPAYYNRKPTARRAYVWADRTPLFPFGYGLTYTTFAYSNLRVEPQQTGPGGSVNVTVQVTNTGTRDGEEVVQLYLHDCVASVTRPVMELKAFRRVALKPGETHAVTFTITPSDWTYLDEHMQPTVEPGMVQVMVGSNSAQYHTVEFEIR